MPLGKIIFVYLVLLRARFYIVSKIFFTVRSTVVMVHPDKLYYVQCGPPSEGGWCMHVHASTVRFITKRTV